MPFIPFFFFSNDFFLLWNLGNQKSKNLKIRQKSKVHGESFFPRVSFLSKKFNSKAVSGTTDQICAPIHLKLCLQKRLRSSQLFAFLPLFQKTTPSCSLGHFKLGSKNFFFFLFETHRIAYDSSKRWERVARSPRAIKYEFSRLCQTLTEIWEKSDRVAKTQI